MEKITRDLYSAEELEYIDYYSAQDKQQKNKIERRIILIPYKKQNDKASDVKQQESENRPINPFLAGRKLKKLSENTNSYVLDDSKIKMLIFNPVTNNFERIDIHKGDGLCEITISYSSSNPSQLIRYHTCLYYSRIDTEYKGKLLLITAIAGPVDCEGTNPYYWSLDHLNFLFGFNCRITLIKNTEYTPETDFFKVIAKTDKEYCVNSNGINILLKEFQPEKQKMYNEYLKSKGLPIEQPENMNTSNQENMSRQELSTLVLGNSAEKNENGNESFAGGRKITKFNTRSIKKIKYRKIHKKSIKRTKSSRN